MAEFQGTIGNDTINGSDDADTISAGEGADTVNGRGGNDTIYGEGGNDTLNGNAGDDQVHGGLGDDSVFGGGGNDTLYGDDGNDWLAAGGTSTYFGGAGNDLIEANIQNGAQMVDGGVGDDTILLGIAGNAVFDKAFTVTAGEGNDSVAFEQGFNNQIDLGPGNDRITYFRGWSTVTLGEGADIVQYGSYSRYPTRAGYLTLNDYQVGVDLVVIPWQMAWLPGWNGVGNPFADGYLRVIQQGADAVFQADFDGPAGPGLFNDLIRFKTIQASALTAADLGGYAPDGSRTPGRTLTGTDASEPATSDTTYELKGLLIGDMGDDHIDGLGGDDGIIGLAGNDTLSGGAGNDAIHSGLGNDVAHGGDGNDNMMDEGGVHDEMYGDAGDDYLVVYTNTAGYMLVDGGIGNDEFSIRQPIDNPVRSSGTLVIRGGDGDDKLVPGVLTPAGMQADMGSGADTVFLYGNHQMLLTLGSGADLLQLAPFSGAASLAATVTDYLPGIDRISLPSAAYFAGWNGTSNPFQGGYVRLVSLGTTGTLVQFDANGGGDAYATVLRLENVAANSLTAADFGGFAPTLPTVLAPANDINGDRHSDVLWRNTGGALTVWNGIEGGFSASGFNAQVSTDWKIADTGDFDGNGRADILWRNDNGTLTAWLSVDGGYLSSSFQSQVSADWRIAGVGDFDGDGRDDILWRNDNGVVTQWLARGPGFDGAGQPSLNVSPGWKIAGLGDFDGDGRDDILWRNDDGRVTQWLGVGNGFNGAGQPTLAVSSDWKVAATGDFDGDGRDDILWRNDDGRITQWLGVGNGFNGAGQPTLSVSNAWHAAGIGDFSGDGRDDIVWRNDNGAITQWLGVGNGFDGADQAVYFVGNEWALAV